MGLDADAIYAIEAADAAGLTELASLGVLGLYERVVPGEDKYSVDAVDLEQYLPNPRRKHGHVSVRSLDSLIAYTARHQSDATEAFIDAHGVISVVLNRHEPSGGDDSGHAGWGDHTVKLERVPTPAWTAWQRHNDKDMAQLDFAEFLEQRMGEIADPPGAMLFEIAKTFTASKSIAFSSSRRLDNGQTQLTWNEVLDGGGVGENGTVTVPSELSLVLRPFKDVPVPPDGTADPYQLVTKARLRWRLHEQRVSFRYILDEGLEQQLDGLYAGDVAAFEQATGLTVIKGEAH